MQTIVIGSRYKERMGRLMMVGLIETLGVRSSMRTEELGK